MLSSIHAKLELERGGFRQAKHETHLRGRIRNNSQPTYALQTNFPAYSIRSPFWIFRTLFCRLISSRIRVACLNLKWRDVYSVMFSSSRSPGKLAAPNVCAWAFISNNRCETMSSILVATSLLKLTHPRTGVRNGGKRVHCVIYRAVRGWDRIEIG